jgi:mannose/fructose/N-acetylgalactosamine-specific phosphotransferase system component IIC
MLKIKKPTWKEVVGIILFVTLLFSIGFTLVKLIFPTEADLNAADYETLKSDRVLMLLQCCLGLAVMFLPTLLERQWSIGIPSYMCILYYIFLYCAIYLGEVRSFYYLIPHWDTILHTFSGGMLGALGFTIVHILNESSRTKVALSPFFVALFAFSFALTIGAVWEIYEFTGDSLFGLNMQKFRMADGTVLIGHSALRDTMKDLISDALSALIVSVIGFIELKKKSGK